MNLKRLLSLMLTFAIMLTFIPTFNSSEVSALTFIPNFEVNSDYAVLYNTDIDSIVYQKNYQTQTDPAQLTQIMTAIVCIENCQDLEHTPVTIPEVIFDEFNQIEAQNPEIFITTSDFKAGEEMTMKDLLYSMMLESACESASTIAYYIGEGSIQSFVDKMNAKAKEIGCLNTNFKNPHGLHADGQYSTAYDMYLITKYAMGLSKFNDIVNTIEYTVPATNMNTEKTINHTNVMLDSQSNYYYEYAKGIKTGNSEQAGSCLITKASKNGSTYLLVLLHAPLSERDKNGNRIFYHIKDAIQIFDWCLDSFEYKTLLSEDEEVKEVKVKFSSGNDYVLLRPKESFSTLWLSTNDISNIERTFEINQDISAPIVQGETLGKMNLILNGEKIYTTDLVATSDLDRSFAKFNIEASKGFIYSAWFNRALLISIILTFVYIGVYIYKLQSMPKKKKRKTSNNGGGSVNPHSAPRVKRVRQVENSNNHNKDR
ncbi:MAG: D-alanyl-D-alanine carboxypeptidase family protein [Oscillospiraceae bacterium]